MNRLRQSLLAHRRVSLYLRFCGQLTFCENHKRRHADFPENLLSLLFHMESFYYFNFEVGCDVLKWLFLLASVKSVLY